MRVAVIVAAAGKSERFGGKEKKIFARLEDRPLFIRSLEAFINRDEVCQTLLAVAPEDAEQIRSRFGANLGFMGVQLVEGGAERWESVRNALPHVRDDATHVAVHDAARPCVNYKMIDAVFAEAAKTGAAILAAPLTGTIKRVSADNVVEQTVSRERLFEAQTPQVFKADLLRRAYDALDPADPPTDDAQLVERLGEAVSVVVSDMTNIKITRQEDLRLALAILKSQPQPRPERPLGPFEEAQW